MSDPQMPQGQPVPEGWTPQPGTAQPTAQPTPQPAPGTAYPPYAPGPQPAYGQYPAAYPPPYIPQPEKPRRGWIWAIVVLVALFTVCGSCVWLGSLFTKDTKGSVALGDAVGVVHLDGVIAGSGTAGVITPESFLEQFEQAEKDDSVKAIVLRVDSPGGTVAASEEIAAYVKACEKPVVVSVGDVAASGAYMVSSQADKIVANAGSAVGSIGVISEIPNVAGLLTKLGVKFTVIHAGKYKDAGSPYREITPAEKALIQGSVNDVYGQFIDIVAQGRNLPRSQVESMATGWAWNGDQAKKLGLVDEIGTYQDALKLAAKLGGITGEFQTVKYDGTKFEDFLNTLLGIRGRLSPLDSLSSGAVTQPVPTLAK